MGASWSLPGLKGRYNIIRIHNQKASNYINVSVKNYCKKLQKKKQ